MNTTFDVVYTPTGHITIRGTSHAGALSAAQGFNAGHKSPWPYRVYPSGTYQHPDTIQAVDSVMSDAMLEAMGLPPIAYVDHALTPEAKVVAIKRGVLGYHPVVTNLSARELNEAAGVTPAQASAMLNGSMFGWHVPAGDPRSPINSKA